MADMTRKEWAVRRVATAIPQPIAEAPERVALNAAFVVIGVWGILVEPPGSLLAEWPEGMDIAWGLTMAVGGACALTGYWQGSSYPWGRPLERLGYMLLLLGTLTFGIGLIWEFGLRGVAVGVLFLFFACSKIVRLIFTSAYRTVLLHQGESDEVGE